MALSSSALCITEHNVPLGLLNLQFFHHDERNTQIVSHKRKLEDRQTDCWLKAIKSTQQQLQDASKKIVSIADREGDFFDFLKYLHDTDQAFIVRAKYNRYTGEKHRQRTGRLFKSLELAEVKARMSIELYETTTRRFNKIHLKLKCLENVKIPRAYSGRGSVSKTEKPILVNAVMAYNKDYRWFLLSSLPVGTKKDLYRVVNFYRYRWHIEDFHKVLKTAYQVEKIYLHASRRALENALTVAALSACRFYWMVYVGRKDCFTPAEYLFKKEEWQSVYVYFKEHVPKEPPPVSDIIQRIAQLGGYKKCKGTKPPGIKTLWMGFQLFTAISIMYKNICQEKLKAN